MRVAFKMQLFPGLKDEYKKRHDEIWPELKELLKNAGVKNYSIFLDGETNKLFGVMTVTDEMKMKELPDHPVMKKWWAYMKDIMVSRTDSSPVSIPLEEVFYLE